ncbi:uncharacterized protein [Dermacentor andersoni]|uniref:uncharacterized protein n=1 Tax=Dermacentor andersoni TaxID=34620 RepID=UPI003B3BDFE9
MQETQRTATIPDKIRNTIKVAPIPKNMDPNLHEERRKARAKYIQKSLASQATTVYVDAATYTRRARQTNSNAVAVVINSDMREIVSASLRDCTVLEAAEAAVALVAAEGYRTRRSLTILTDSQTACQNYMLGRIGNRALRILRSEDHNTQDPEKEQPIRHTIVWAPGHTDVEGNREVDRVARGYTPVPREYSAILNHYKGSRKRYPPPHSSLTREDSVAWRLLQTSAYPNLNTLSKIQPTQYTDKCPWCQETPTLYHITWACQKTNAAPIIPNPSAEQWEGMLSSDRQDVQLGLIRQAQLAAASSGALD